MRWLLLVRMRDVADDELNSLGGWKLAAATSHADTAGDWRRMYDELTEEDGIVNFYIVDTWAPYTP